MTRYSSPISRVVDTLAAGIEEIEKHGFSVESLRNSFSNMERTEAHNPKAKPFVLGMHSPYHFAVHASVLSGIKEASDTLGFDIQETAALVGQALKESENETIIRFRNSFDIGSFVGPK
ncbi:MAG: hypothetical protein AAF182_03165 [Pseudomonadota bacterium]